MSKDLVFEEFSILNAQRCAAVFHPINEWTLLEWAGAMAGEAGEAANIAKKFRRLDKADKSKDTIDLRRKLLRKLIEEAADTTTYADLLVTAAVRLGAEYGIKLPDLGRAVRRKFNVVSKKRGFGEKL